MSNHKRKIVVVMTAFGLLLSLFYIKNEGNAAESAKTSSNENKYKSEQNMSDKSQKSDKEWKEILTPEQYRVTRLKGTEKPFTGKYYDFEGEGVYKCICCGEILFKSDNKFDAGCGWPSFWDAIDESKIKQEVDTSLGMRRIEITCANCGAHLGHVFDDGPNPTGLRYCVNSVSIDFEAEKEIDTTAEKKSDK